MALVPSQARCFVRLFKRLTQQGKPCHGQPIIMHRFASTDAQKELDDENVGTDLIPMSRAKKTLINEFPSYYRDGKFISKMSYVEFIDEALARSKELGVERDIEFYKELLRILPTNRFHPTNRWEFGNVFAGAQQRAAMRIFLQMQLNKLVVDSDFEKLIVSIFSIKSEVWLTVARYTYWSMKFRNLEEHPLPEKLPEEPHQLAKLALMRMQVDHKSLLTVTNTVNVPDSVDKTWVVSSQSPTQQAIIDRLEDGATLYIEEGGLSYVGRQFLSYFVLRYYVDDDVREAKAKAKPPDFNFNTVKVSFYGKPIKEKLESLEDKHYSDGSYILGICATGTSSQDSLLSWLKILQRRNPRLNKLNVLFRMSRTTPEIVAYDASRQQQGDQPGNSSGDKTN